MSYDITELEIVPIAELFVMCDLTCGDEHGLIIEHNLGSGDHMVTPLLDLVAWAKKCNISHYPCFATPRWEVDFSRALYEDGKEVAVGPASVQEFSNLDYVMAWLEGETQREEPE